jgi:hypothetical protein
LAERQFSDTVVQKLGFYVYRLIDPLDGETFYVGKGIGNRVFAHAMDELGSVDDALSYKLQKIREIRLRGYEVGHVIHRHGMDEPTAFEVEAALIDAYPKALNIAGGHASDERGIMTAKEIIERHDAPEVVFRHRVLALDISRLLLPGRSIYDVTRYAWVLDKHRAEQCEVILAVSRGLIVGAFVADAWLDVTSEFPSAPKKRWAFNGKEARADVCRMYVGGRIPATLRPRGAANPVRYYNKSTPAKHLDRRAAKT